MPFLDRRDAGRRLAQRLRILRRPDVVVLGVPCGGMPVAFEVAAALRVPLDLAIVRRLRVPYRPSLVFGAVGEEGITVHDEDVVARALVSGPERLSVHREQREHLVRSIVQYRGEFAARRLDGCAAVVVDDGIDTAVVARAAVEIARARGAGRVMVAAPVGASRAIRSVSEVADHVVCLETPPLFGSIRPWYQNFGEVSESEVGALLDQAATPATDAPADYAVRRDCSSN